MNGVDVHRRNLRVQSRNHQQLQQQGQDSGPGGIHSLDPSFNGAQNSSGPSHPYGQQALMQSPSLLGIPNQNVYAMAQQQMALLNVFQPIPLAMNPLLNAPGERYSDRHGSVNHGRSNSSRNYPYQRDDYSRNSSYQRDNYSNDYRKHSYNHHNTSSNHYSNRNSEDKYGHFDFNRLGPQQNRDNHHYSAHGNDHHSRHGDRHRSESSHRYDSHRSSGRHHTSHHDKNYR